MPAIASGKDYQLVLTGGIFNHRISSRRIKIPLLIHIMATAPGIVDDLDRIILQIGIECRKGSCKLPTCQIVAPALEPITSAS